MVITHFVQHHLGVPLVPKIGLHGLALRPQRLIEIEGVNDDVSAGGKLSVLHP